MKKLNIWKLKILKKDSIVKKRFLGYNRFFTAKIKHVRVSLTVRAIKMVPLLTRVALKPQRFLFPLSLHYFFKISADK